MKKVVRMLGLCALVALAFTACKKNETNSTLSFKASITQPSSADRTHIGGEVDLVWDNNDVITVFDKDGINEDFTAVIPEGNVSRSHEFPIAPEKADFMANLLKERYSAYYPLKEAFDGTKVKLEVSASQTYADHNFMPGAYPMYAENNNNGDNFIFHSHAGILRIPVRGAQGVGDVTFDKIIVSSSEDDILAGIMLYDYTNNTYTVAEEGRASQVVIQSETKLNVTNQQALDFNIVLLENALNGSFTVTVWDGETLLGTFNANSTYNKILPETIIVMPDAVIPQPQ